jgi:hypothetical protein
MDLRTMSYEPSTNTIRRKFWFKSKSRFKIQHVNNIQIVHHLPSRVGFDCFNICKFKQLWRCRYTKQMKFIFTFNGHDSPNCTSYIFVTINPGQVLVDVSTKFKIVIFANKYSWWQPYKYEYCNQCSKISS